MVFTTLLKHGISQNNLITLYLTMHIPLFKPTNKFKQAADSILRTTKPNGIFCVNPRYFVHLTTLQLHYNAVVGVHGGKTAL